MLMNLWLTTFLIYKEGGNWIIVVWHHVHTPAAFLTLKLASQMIDSDSS